MVRIDLGDQVGGGDVDRDASREGEGVGGGGRIEEAGTHDELIAAGGRYAQLYGTWAELAAA